MKRSLGAAATVSLVVPSVAIPVAALAPTAQAGCQTAGCAAPVPCNTHAGSCWVPAPNTRWQYQLQAARDKKGNCLCTSTGGIDVEVSATPFTGGAAVHPTVFDIDFQTDGACTGGAITQENAAAVSAIHAAVGKAICYIDAGRAETFRPDFPEYAAFDESIGGALFGEPVSGFRDEYWLNINDERGQRDFILGEISKRLDRCVADGFDGVETDVVNAWSNKTGLSISPDTQLLFNTALANLAHGKSLTVALKNDVEQVPDLAPYFDYAINEQCQQYKESGNYTTYVASSNKAVFQVEYKLKTSRFCPQANAEDRNAIRKTYDLFDTPWMPCR